MKKLLLAILLCCSFGIATPLLAQDAAASDLKCDLDTANKMVDIYLDGLQKLKDTKPTDPVKIVGMLQILNDYTNELRATCSGLTFTGTASKVIGPVEIPAGIYRAVATTDGYLIVKVSALTGECGAGSDASGEHLFGISGGEAKTGAEAVFASKGCNALIETSLVDAAWRLSFERINTK